MTPIGRDEEVAAAVTVLDALSEAPAALVLTGAAGIGKTTLWRAILADARSRGYRTLRTQAVETEAQLAFGGLADLFDRVIDEALDGLPPVQRAALEVALQRVPAEGHAPPLLAASLGALAAIRAMAGPSPLVIAVDDLQWLDTPSLRIIEYVARRVSGVRVGFLLAIRSVARDGPFPAALAAFAGPVRHIHLGPLDMDATDALIRRELGVSMRRPALAWIHAESGGNAFQCLEIARALQRTGAAPGLEGLASSMATDDLLRARLDALPDTARWPLAAAGALARPTVEVLTAADPSAPDGLEAARSAGVIELDAGRVRFSHPLLAAAAYGAVAGTERQALHARLAAVLADLEERAQHLALSIDAPSEAVAVELEAAAVHAQGRGASGSAAELLLQAAQRTPAEDRDDRHRRTVSAAEYLIRSGDPTRALSVLQGHLAITPPGPARAAALRVLADARSSDDWEAKGRLLEEALQVTGDDHRLRSTILQDLAQTRFHLGRDARGQLALAMEAVAEAEASQDAVTRCSAYLSAVLAHGNVGRRPDPELLDRAMALSPQVEHLRVLFWPAFCKALMDLSCDRIDAAIETFTELRLRAAAAGDWDSLPVITTDLARAVFRHGDWHLASQVAIEAERGSRQNGQAMGLSRALFARAMVEIVSGHEQEGQLLVEEGIVLAREVGARSAQHDHHLALGFLAFSTGDIRRAEAELRKAVEPRLAEGFATAPMPQTLWAETLVLLDRPEEGGKLLELVEDVAARFGQPSALAACARVRGLMATASGDEAGASAGFATALAFHDQVAEPFERARTLLAQGESRRRFRRRGQARDALAAALRIFTELGAPRWLERAAAELARTGHRESGAELAPTEEQIARLVAAGHTNREIAGILFMSPHTVEAHLTRVYRSLGIRGRTELARVMTGRSNEDHDPATAPRDQGFG